MSSLQRMSMQEIIGRQPDGGNPRARNLAEGSPKLEHLVEVAGDSPGGDPTTN